MEGSGPLDRLGKARVKNRLSNGKECNKCVKVGKVGAAGDHRRRRCSPVTSIRMLSRLAGKMQTVE